MDALPIKEQTGLPHASTVTVKNDAGETVPVMHGCGHDIHMASWIGAATFLARARDQWHGTLVFVGQPAEEVVRRADRKPTLSTGVAAFTLSVLELVGRPAGGT